MPVNRCVCHDVPFATLIDLAQRGGLDLDALAERTGATTGCGSCRPYVRIALATGRSELPPIPSNDLERVASECERRAGALRPSSD